MHETERKVTSRQGTGWTKRILFAAVCILLLLLTVRAYFRKQIRETAEGFLDALADTDAEAAARFSTQEVLQSPELSFLYPEKIEELLYEELGTRNAQTERKDLSEEAQTAMRDFAAALSDRAILDRTVLDTAGNGHKGTVLAEVTFGYPPDHELLFDSSGNAAEEIEAYEKEHREELLEIYTAQGEQAMNRKIYSDVIAIMASSMKDAVLEAEPFTAALELTVERKDGRWIVTGLAERLTESGENGNSD